MATREVLQEGRRVIVDSKGNKTYAPFRPPVDEESQRRSTPKTLGSGAAAASAQAILDARARREAESETSSNSGYKRGGVVKKATSKPAIKRPPAKQSKRR